MASAETTITVELSLEAAAIIVAFTAAAERLEKLLGRIEAREAEEQYPNHDPDVWTPTDQDGRPA